MTHSMVTPLAPPPPCAPWVTLVMQSRAPGSVVISFSLPYLPLPQDTSARLPLAQVILSVMSPPKLFHSSLKEVHIESVFWNVVPGLAASNAFTVSPDESAMLRVRMAPSGISVESL